MTSEQRRRIERLFHEAKGPGARGASPEQPTTASELETASRLPDPAVLTLSWTLLPIWARVVMGVALLQTAVSLAIYLSDQFSAQVPLPVPAWVYALLSTAFGVCGLGLVAGNRNDSRAAWLGGSFALIAAPLAAKLVDGADTVRWMALVRPQVFIGAFLWQFLARFPSALSGPPRKLIRIATAAAAGVGILCVVPAVQTAWLASQWPPPAWTSILFANRPGRVNWLLVLAAAAPVLPLLVWRVRVASGDDRQRLELFIRGLIAGVAPFTLEVLVEETWPAYMRLAHSPAVEPWIGGVIFGALGVVPFITAYSVLFDRVFQIRVVLRMAIQYALARYTIIAATLIPFAALAALVFARRDEPLAALMNGARPLMLGGAGGLGLVALRLGSTWRDALDRRYFREAYDAREVLTHVLSGLRADSVEELARGVRDELERALHAGAEVFIADDAGTNLVDVAGRLWPLATSTALVQFVHADAAPMRVDMTTKESAWSRLPKTEREWIEEGPFALLIALRDASGGLMGMLALTSKRSGLEYSAADRDLLSSVASAVGLVVESLRRRSAGPSAPEPRARECTTCSRLSPSDARRCSCGGEFREANIPHVLRGVFRVEQRIGAGGMGVVYRAVDVNLRREVAIKALPRVNQDEIARLRREARSMAAVEHANLAVIYGIETWNGLPFLIEEYLAGGTLAGRLKAGPLSFSEALDLGITIADVLRDLHAAGIVHCDIKPGNIGFTAQGVVKLLDFGLARVLRDARATDMASTRSASQPIPQGWFGTPHYMSPEAARGERARPSFDLWALGVVLYQAVSGRLPYEGDDAISVLAHVARHAPPSVRTEEPDVPEGFAAFLEEALAGDAARRPPTAAAFGEALRRLRGSFLPS
jgi:hypothetical protein